ncbi:MAG: hypothetical protein IJ223_01505 [Clostridia bacterium]|nr:hypothetical protein [Clostridia bacterium]
MTKICVRDSEGVMRFVKAEYVSDYDSEGKLKIFKYADNLYALLRIEDWKVMVEGAGEIQKVKNGMSYYTNKKGEWGILNDRGEITCPAGVLKSSRKEQ